MLTWIVLAAIVGLLVWNNGLWTSITTWIKSKVPVVVQPTVATIQTTVSTVSTDVHTLVDHWLGLAAVATDAESVAALNVLRTKVLQVPTAVLPVAPTQGK